MMPAAFPVCTSRFPRLGGSGGGSGSPSTASSGSCLWAYTLRCPLKEARLAALEARQLVAAGRDPVRERAGARSAVVCHSVREVAGEWLAGQEEFLRIFPVHSRFAGFSSLLTRSALAIHRCLPLPDGRFPVGVNSLRHSWHFRVIPYELEYFCKSIHIIKFLPG